MNLTLLGRPDSTYSLVSNDVRTSWLSTEPPRKNPGITWILVTPACCYPQLLIPVHSRGPWVHSFERLRLTWHGGPSNTRSILPSCIRTRVRSRFDYGRGEDTVSVALSLVTSLPRFQCPPYTAGPRTSAWWQGTGSYWWWSRSASQPQELEGSIRPYSA